MHYKAVVKDVWNKVPIKSLRHRVIVPTEYLENDGN